MALAPYCFGSLVEGRGEEAVLFETFFVVRLKVFFCRSVFNHLALNEVQPSLIFNSVLPNHMFT